MSDVLNIYLNVLQNSLLWLLLPWMMFISSLLSISCCCHLSTNFIFPLNAFSSFTATSSLLPLDSQGFLSILVHHGNLTRLSLFCLSLWINSPSALCTFLSLFIHSVLHFSQCLPGERVFAHSSFPWLLKNFTFSSWIAAPVPLLCKHCSFFCVALLPLLIKASPIDASGPCANFAALSHEVSALLFIPSLFIPHTSIFPLFHCNTNQKSTYFPHAYLFKSSLSFSYHNIKFSFSSFFIDTPSPDRFYFLPCCVFLLLFYQWCKH